MIQLHASRTNTPHEYTFDRGITEAAYALHPNPSPRYALLLEPEQYVRTNQIVFEIYRNRFLRKGNEGEFLFLINGGVVELGTVWQPASKSKGIRLLHEKREGVISLAQTLELPKPTEFVNRIHPHTSR